MAKIIKLEIPRNPGNGAREAIARYFKVRKANLGAVDHFLASMWVRGFAVVPLDKMARPNPLQVAWDADFPARVARHKAAILQLGRNPKLRGDR